ncbi:hypothetical protein [Methylococcus sp. EFPC2]|uniref:hypothetical protein n=1 Tax=Methylococcus sp. EFPC2 TaxID=2812648 RepID=UPI0019675F5D|nr:hypothetical protein [Methylococcus sp. EFPC2]QSA96515.1 hypothetical protein JWZ97_15010 [Methylococcus sp. EFPC2]
MTDIFNLEPNTTVLQDDSYILSYPHLLSYFAAKQSFGPEDVVCGAHMVYGWMPTVLELYPESPNIDLPKAAELLTKAKTTGVLTDDEIEQLARLVNNSLVGASKLLHFVSPERFAIWDSKIYAFVYRERPHNYRVSQVSKYRSYLTKLDQHQKDSRFATFHNSVNTKIGYSVSALRALELVMFLNAPVFGG